MEIQKVSTEVQNTGYTQEQDGQIRLKNMHSFWNKIFSDRWNQDELAPQSWGKSIDKDKIIT